MRILLVIPRYPGQDGFIFGGSTRMFSLLARAFAARGHDVTVLTTDLGWPDRRLGCEETPPGARIEVRRSRVWSPWLATHFAALFSFPFELRNALRAAVRTADVVHMGEARGLHNRWVAETCNGAGVPLVWSAFGGLSESKGLRVPYYALRDAFFTRTVVDHVTGFVAQTEHEANVYRSYGAQGDRIHLVPLCFDPTELDDLPQRGVFRRRFQVPDSASLVLTVARLHPNKGLDMLLLAFARLAIDPAPHLAVVGWDQGAGRRLARLASELGLRSRVHFCGPLFGRELQSAYVDADAFVLAPQVHEETSLASLEAAACGLPPVLTPRASIPGLTNVDQRLEVRPVAAELSSALEWLLADRDERRTLSARVKDFVWSNFSVDLIAGQHEALYRSLVR